MIKAVVFDLGEVLSSPPSLLPALAAHIGTTEEELRQHYWTGRPEYDAGAPDANYWGPLLEALGSDHDAHLIAELAYLDADIWSNLRPSAWQLLRDCRGAGVVVAILSNSPHAMQAAAEETVWRADVDHLYISATLGAMKPQPEMYARVQTDLGLDPGEIAFIDDKPANVEAALSAGWFAHVWESDSNTRTWLESLGVLSFG